MVKREDLKIVGSSVYTVRTKYVCELTGKERMFRKGQLILKFDNGMIGTMDGRYGREIVCW